MTEPAMFADDTSLSATGETPAEIQNKLRREIQNVSATRVRVDGRKRFEHGYVWTRYFS